MQASTQIAVSRQTLVAIERGQRLPSLEIAHRIAEALECRLDDVFHYRSELPAKDDDDSISVIVRVEDEPEWWKADDVSRVTAERSAVVTRHRNRTTTRSGQVKLKVLGE